MVMNLIRNHINRGELRESKDEILIGEVILAMAAMGWPAVGFQGASGAQQVRFRPQKDVQGEILHSLQITLDRKTGDGLIGQAVFGSKAFVTVMAEVKNRLADPDDLLEMYRTDIQNLIRIPLLGDVKLNHEFNSIFAIRKVMIEIDDFLSRTGEDRLAAIQAFLEPKIEELRQALRRYKK